MNDITPELRARLESINLIGKRLDEVREATKGLNIDHLALLRSVGRMSVGQYAYVLSLGAPWFDILES